MRTDTLTALLLDPFLTYDEAVRQCGVSAPTATARAGHPAARPARATGLLPRRQLRERDPRPAGSRAELCATASR